ncbi:hypothetical protein BDY19DRAFT_924543 [Irpex rosettiformis]|uniref:Uncharacterized protein n=1 Tax=Irpex rosettiformis TaxID=378272 RepID=A0ACB8UDX8_9APHY|nr:hypothetical protein BDY19DRAFT_924543 [Irpex rosettiformis]
MMHAQAIVLASLFATSFAYYDTNPLIAWSSHSPNALSSLPKSSYTPDFLHSLLASENICDHDAVVFVSQAGLHASDLRSLSRSSTLAQKLGAAASSVELPYMRRSIDDPLTNVARAVAERCGARTLSVSCGEVGPHIAAGTREKHVVSLGMPTVDGSFGNRKQLMKEYVNLLSLDLETISSEFPKHLVVYAGWMSSLETRQELPDEESTSLEGTLLPPPVKGAAKAAPSDGGILKKYQLLTPGLIISLAVTFFVLVPIVFMGISSLASIQSPVRLDAPKGFSAVEKKNQ